MIAAIKETVSNVRAALAWWVLSKLFLLHPPMSGEICKMIINRIKVEANRYEPNLEDISRDELINCPCRVNPRIEQ
jgi:hypothetical protein